MTEQDWWDDPSYLQAPEFQYESFGQTIEFAESLGWVDNHPDASDPEYDADMADAVEGDALVFIKSKGYRVVGL